LVARNAWCRLWTADDRFELRLARGGRLQRVELFRDPIRARTATRRGVRRARARELGELFLPVAFRQRHIVGRHETLVRHPRHHRGDVEAAA
jgi:hypothetical protein